MGEEKGRWIKMKKFLNLHFCRGNEEWNLQRANIFLAGGRHVIPVKQKEEKVKDHGKNERKIH